MKKIILFILFLCMAGCATVSIPNYIDPQHPYVRKVYGDYNAIVVAVRQVLADEGWAVQSETSPSTYERDGSAEGSATSIAASPPQKSPAAGLAIFMVVSLTRIFHKFA